MCHNQTGADTKAIPTNGNVNERNTAKIILANTNIKPQVDFCKFGIKCLQVEISCLSTIKISQHALELVCKNHIFLFKLPSHSNAEVTFITAISLVVGVNNINMECDWLMVIQEIFLDKYQLDRYVYYK